MNPVERHEPAVALLRAAVLAPSSHNTQPWRFRVAGSTIDLLADRTRALAENDPQDRELTISCGCALMNLRSAAAQRGLQARVQLRPVGELPDWLARVTLSEGSNAPASEGALAEFMALRRTHRERFAPRPVDSATLDQLIGAATAEGAWLRPLSGEEVRRQAAALVAEGDAVQWAKAGWRRELAAWMHTRRRGDGLTLPGLMIPLAKLIVRGLDLGARVGAQDRELARSSPVLAVLGSPGDHPTDWLQAGQALQRILLVACRHGLQASYLNQPIQVAVLRPRLQALVGDGFPQLPLRLGYPPDQAPASPRRPVEEVIEWAG